MQVVLVLHHLSSELHSLVPPDKSIPDVAQFHGLARPRELDKKKEGVVD